MTMMMMAMTMMMTMTLQDTLAHIKTLDAPKSLTQRLPSLSTKARTPLTKQQQQQQRWGMAAAAAARTTTETQRIRLMMMMMRGMRPVLITCGRGSTKNMRSIWKTA